MKVGTAIATYRRLREQPLWRLLAADNGPAIIALLQTHLFEGQRSLQASVFHERIGRDLEELRSMGYDLPRTAQLYVADWLAAGYLERRFPAGAIEEEYELSSAAAGAIRLVASLVEPRTAATESRLAVVIQQLVRLAEETDANPQTRIAALLAERERIDREIEAIRQGRLEMLPHASALERIREIVALADDLAGDFRRVRDQFEHLNRDLRERLVDSDTARGEVLEAHLSRKNSPFAGQRKQRTAGELLAAAAAEQARLAERQAAERARREREAAEARAQARAQYLDQLAGREEATWQKVEMLIQTKQPNKYDEAVKLLVDLRDLAPRCNQEAAFQTALRKLRDTHAAKPSLLRRFSETGL